MTPRYEFYADHKGAWITSESVTTKTEADRLNEIIGREFYREVKAA
ncbi:hypothetical protein [Streptomyces sp. AC495_CC817]|nr:hypothetical protein [Streptomyces sp. AC495_CC817]